MSTENTLSESEQKQKNREMFKVACTVWASIFIMGFINAFSLSLIRQYYYDDWLLGAMLTPQTGNLVWMGKHLASGNWAGLLTTIMLFVGFGAGNIFGFYHKSKFADKRKQFFFSWTCFILPIIIFPVYMHFIGTNIAMFIMGFAAGTGLSLFRQVYHLDVNNAMATGNARFMPLWFWRACIRRDRTADKEVFTFVLFTVCILSFVFGASLYTLASKFGPTGIANFYISEFVLIVVCLIPYSFAPKDPNLVKPTGTYGGGINYKK